MGFELGYINKEFLEELSYESKLGKSLKKTIRRFEKADIITELLDLKEFYESNKLLTNPSYDFEYRIKSLHSSLLKYNKYYPSTEMNKCFNDLLGIRILVDDYDSIKNQDLSIFKVADMTNGKANDDGYRGIHLYYQKSNLHYPIEIQINTYSDRKFNDWLHNYLYKYTKDNSIGVKLRELYEDGIIKDTESFKEELESVLSNSEKI